MRSFDLHNRYYDNNNQPLRGCVMFMVKSGNTVAPIFDNNGTALDNPQLTDVYGRTQHQVFIVEDVTAYFYKYIGNGIWYNQGVIDPSDTSLWQLQYTVDSELNVDINITSSSPLSVLTINDLRALDVDNVPEINGNKVITLLGYNALGDKEPINYIWDSESMLEDNAGSVICNNELLKGRWIMVQPTAHCDSRHFGIFPSNSHNMNDQTFNIIKLFDYCNAKGINPFFDANGDYVWYKYTSIELTTNQIDISKGVQFYDVGNSTITAEWSNDPHFVQRNTNVVAKNVKTSWDAKSYSGYENVIIDKYSEQKNFQDAYIDARMVPTYGYNFNHCTFAENRSLGSNNGTDYNTFFDCTLTSKMFIVTGNNVTSFATGQASNCEARQEDWIENEDAFFYYVQLRMTNVPDANFDYKGRTSSNNPVVNYSGRVITSDVIRLNNYNYIGSNCLVDRCDASILEINNCTGRYNLSNWTNGCTILIKNCHDFIISDVANNVTLKIESSEVTLESNNKKINCYLKDSSLVGDNNTIYNFENFTSYDSIISITIKAANSVVKDSQINGTYEMVAQPGTTRSVLFRTSYVDVSHFIHGYFDNNIFNAKFIINGQSANTEYGVNHVLVDGLIFQNNRSNLTSLDAWSISRLGAMASDKLNAYTYVNNTGGFECSKQVLNAQIVPKGSLLSPEYNGMLTETMDNVVESYRLAQNISTDPEHPSYADVFNAYFTKMRMFIIGLYDASVDLEITILPNPGPGGSWTGGVYYLNPNATKVGLGTEYNFTCALTSSSTMLAHLTTDSKYINGTIDNSHKFVLADLGKDPYSTSDEWQIRNFILGKGLGWSNNISTNPNISLQFRQADKRN